MRKRIGLLAVLTLGAATLYGQATRTWVSGVGDDANPCSRTAPCKTFAGAISKTTPGGEINALDPGGFGALTITKSITLDGGGGQVASILVTGTNGIVVAAGSNDVVIIRNMRLDGLLGGGNGNAGLNGIRFISGKDLEIENVNVFGFNQNGIDIELNQNTQGSVHIYNSVVQNVAGVGIFANNAQTPPVEVGIEGTKVVPMGTSTNNHGIDAGLNTRFMVRNSFVSEAGGDGLRADTGNASLNIAHTGISFNTNGITAAPGGFVGVFDSQVTYSSNCGLNNTAGGAHLFTIQPVINTNFSNQNWGNVNATCGTITGQSAF